MQRETWSAMGAQGEVVHAIAVVHADDTGTALCGNHGALSAREAGMKACVNCQETLKALVDTMPDNAVV